MTAKEIKEMVEAVNPIPFGRFREIMVAEREGRLLITPCIAMIEQSLQDGKMKPQRDQAHNGRYAVVYVDKSKWGKPLIDICGTHCTSKIYGRDRKLG